MAHKVDITFTQNGKEYTGELDSVSGMAGESYHLMINNYYCGCLRRVRGKWVFNPTPKTQSFAELAEFFGSKVQS